VFTAAISAVLNTESRGDDKTRRKARAAATHKKHVEEDNDYVRQQLAKVRQKYAAMGVSSEKIQFTRVTLRTQKSVTGLKRLTRAQLQAQRKKALFTKRRVAAGEALPRKWDVRDEIKKQFPDENLTVQDQGNCGSCWAFAGVGAFEASYLYNKLGRGPGLSEEYVLSCAGSNGSCDGGTTTAAFDVLKSKGSPKRSDLPYVGYAIDCADASSHSIYYRALDWGVLDNVDPNTGRASRDDLKRALMEHGALVVGFYASDAFMNTHISTQDDVFDIAENGDANHAIVLLGWDDDKGAWLIKNSWSTGWGAGGYMWIKYDINQLGVDAAWVTAQGSAPEPPGPGPVTPPGPGPAPAPAPSVIPPLDPEVERLSSLIRQRLDWYRVNYPQYVTSP
jgi:C1A family cysteine protease